tara:strand:+ start:149 stop:457 length:309 start_codon:yes stop_codon:yes gene_type:complete
MHLLGGLWVSLFTIWLYFESNISYINISQDKISRIAAVISTVLIVSLMWEIFELAIGTPLEADYTSDTTLDLVMDIVGGLLGLLLFYTFDFSTFSFIKKGST